MVLKVEPFRAAIRSAKASLPPGSPVIFLSPQGRRFDQGVAQSLARYPGMVLVSGRYEGFDERLVESEADDEISLGDFVLSGGEIAAVAVIDAIVRLQPDALGDNASAEQDSFSNDLLDYPQFTRPESIDEMSVPDVLTTGDHEQIRRWRLKQALGRTYVRRPDLLEDRALTKEEQQLLQEYLAEQELDTGEDSPIRH
jgi:tRNA (guanine37-N1)-methyltransferase